MTITEALRKRIQELADERQISLTNLCLNCALTPSTVFDFMYGKSKHPQISTINKICKGCGITLQQFFAKDYFDNID